MQYKGKDELVNVYQWGKVHVVKHNISSAMSLYFKMLWISWMKISETQFA